jgi:hypothetical protein
VAVFKLDTRNFAASERKEPARRPVASSSGGAKVSRIKKVAGGNAKAAPAEDWAEF